MWFKHRAWIPIAWVLSLINVGSVWFAARDGEPWHVTVHAALAILFALGAQRLRARQRPELKSRVVDPTEQGQTLEDVQASLGELDQLKRRMSELEERVDFAERLLTKQREAQRLDPPQD
jgi:Tfp pilus assembly protein PilO